MSAVPGDFLRVPPPRVDRRRETPDERALQRFWQWFAVGVLLFCWAAEATLCALRGF